MTPPGGAARLIHPPPGEWKSTRRARGGGAARGGKVPAKGTARTKMCPPRSPLQPPRRPARCPPRLEHVYKRHAEPSSRRGSPAPPLPREELMQYRGAIVKPSPLASFPRVRIDFTFGSVDPACSRRERPRARAAPRFL